MQVDGENIMVTEPTESTEKISFNATSPQAHTGETQESPCLALFTD